MSIGFIHGVMNTDNVSVACETIDYGPCAFMDEYNHNMVFSSIDRNSRYAYLNQPYISHWNLSCLANAIFSLIGEDSSKEIHKIMEEYPQIYEKFWLQKMCRKLALKNNDEQDRNLIIDLLNIMHENRLDFTNSFRNINLDNDEINSTILKDWRLKWKNKLEKENIEKDVVERLIKKNNPAYIPRNHLVEKAIRAGVDDNDFSVMDKLLEAMQNPFDESKEFVEFKNLPKETQRITKTYCGT